MKKGSGVLGLIVLVIFGIMIVWNLVSGIIGLSNSEFTELSVRAEVGKLCEVKAHGTRSKGCGCRCGDTRFSGGTVCAFCCCFRENGLDM